MQLEFEVFEEALAVCRYPAGFHFDFALLEGSFWAVQKTPDELSLVVPTALVLQLAASDDLRVEAGWSCLKVVGPLDFALTGILAEISSALAEAGLSLFALSTFDTDYILVRTENLEQACAVLRARGHAIPEP